MIISWSLAEQQSLFTIKKQTLAFSLTFLFFHLFKELVSSFKFETIGEAVAQFEFPD